MICSGAGRAEPRRQRGLHHLRRSPSSRSWSTSPRTRPDRSRNRRDPHRSCCSNAPTSPNRPRLRSISWACCPPTAITTWSRQPPWSSIGSTAPASRTLPRTCGSGSPVTAATASWCPGPITPPPCPAGRPGGARWAREQPWPSWKQWRGLPGCVDRGGPSRPGHSLLDGRTRHQHNNSASSCVVSAAEPVHPPGPHPARDFRETKEPTMLRIRVLGRIVPVALLLGSLAAAPQASAEFPPSTPAAALPVAVSWGGNAAGQIGDNSLAQRLVPVLSVGGTALDGKEVSKVSAGYSSSCAVAEGSLYCWGANGNGQLGIGSNTSKSQIPVQVGGPFTNKFVTDVSVGSNSACAVADGDAYCWGSNDHGQLGDGTFTDRNSPVPVVANGALSGRKVSAVSTNSFHACAIARGAAFCWGENANGELGNSGFDPGNHNFPVPVFSAGLLNGVTINSIATGYDHTCVTGAGHAYCWGKNDNGQLGTGDNLNTINPRSVSSTGVMAGKSVFALAAGGNSTCAIAGVAATRSAYCWGDNSGGQVGDNTLTDRNSPVKVTLVGTATAITVDELGGCSIVDGTAYCWGKNDNGRLGNNSTTLSKHPVKVSQAGVLGTRRELAVSAGRSHTAAVAVTSPVFGDVGANASFYDDIEWVAGTGTSTGYAGSPTPTYHPLDNIERQAMAAFLFRSANPGVIDAHCAGDDTDRYFHDVHTGDVFCGDIEWLVDHGIAVVPPSGLFHPVDGTTRAVLASWMFRSLHPQTSDQPCAGTVFSDVNATKSADCGNIEWLAGAGVTTGYPDGSFHPKDLIRRDAMAAFFHRADALTSH
ncbi:hypothetical protein D1871_14330 [Nakamurella silvestris]|nr:hypothetical protein D1871_14330 [Nakamurella silvestris]